MNQNPHITVKPDHPLWTSFDDDDWGGATCDQWIRLLTDMDVELLPPSDCTPDLLTRIYSSIVKVARSVVVK